jgi:hypothetical protein
VIIHVPKPLDHGGHTGRRPPGCFAFCSRLSDGSGRQRVAAAGPCCEEMREVVDVASPVINLLKRRGEGREGKQKNGEERINPTVSILMHRSGLFPVGVQRKKGQQTERKK